MSKILKNNTASPISIVDTGVTILASPGQYTIPPQDYLLWASSNNVITQIGSGNLIVNDGSLDLSISNGIDLIKGLFPQKIQITDVSNGYDANVTSTGRLKVDTIISPSTGSVPTFNSKLRYDDMNASVGGVARQTVITNSSWTTIYSYSGSGLISSFVINIEDKNNWQIRFVVDNEEIFSSVGLYTSDLVSDVAYDLDDAGSPLSANEGNIGLSLEEHDRFIWVCPTSFPVRFTSSVQILLKRIAGQASKKFQAGLIILAKE